MTFKRLLLSVTLLLFISRSHCQLSTNQEIQSAAITQQTQELDKQVDQLKKELQVLNKRADDLAWDSLLSICFAISFFLE